MEAELRSSVGDRHLRDELHELRADLRALRDKNHQLVQDNIQLTEHLKDATRGQRCLTPPHSHASESSHAMHRSSRYSSPTRHASPERYRPIGKLRQHLGWES